MSTRLLALLIRILTGIRAGKRQVAQAARAIRRTAAGASVELARTAERGRTLRVSAVQMELRLERSVAGYADHLHRLVRDAVAGGGELIVFPEDAPTGLIGLIPGVERFAGGENPRPDEATPHLSAGGLEIASLFRALTPALHRVYIACFAALAAAYGVHILAGSGMFALREAVTNTAHLFGPAGLLATQDKLHFIPMEREWGLVEGEHLDVVQLPGVRMAFPVCMDATYYETFRIAASKGAELIVIPTANPERYDFWRSLRGIRTRIDENAMYGINACMVGSLLGLPLEGRSAVLAPYEMTGRGDGILIEASDAVSEQVVTFELDFGQLAAYRKRFTERSEPNTALYRTYYNRIYGRGEGPKAR